MKYTGVIGRCQETNLSLKKCLVKGSNKLNNTTSMRSLKKVQFIIVFCVATVFVLTSSTEKNGGGKKTNLYEYETVVTSEDNLKNLFKNFPIFIENGNEIDFLSYQYIGTVRNKKDAKKYVRRNFDDLIPIGWNMPYQSNENSYSSSVRLDLQTIHETKSELKEMIKTVSEEYVNVGDEVYQINYVFNLQKHVHYIFISPESKKVLLKGNIFGIEIPISHFEYIEKNKVK